MTLLWPTKIKIAGQQTLSTTLGHQPKPVKIEEIPTKIINNMDPTSQEASLSFQVPTQCTTTTHRASPFVQLADDLDGQNTYGTRFHGWSVGQPLEAIAA
ncbi:hypothetical protein MJO29_009803 [Puccinia striiformis f. sp. tritici]|nr:hypothetical protein MJO29_014163 [Puccinia striiformis f. sp. tritici]KAI7951129.1 hypothetical protein MJO29_009803 [Puccinia striiformis f. sp. tritici]